MSNFKDTLLTALLVVAAAALFVGGYMLGKRFARPLPPPQPQVDTIIVRDTITAYKPKEITKMKIDTQWLAVTDTIRLRDTLYVVLDREQIEWTDSLCTIWASGILPAVDSVRHYTSTQIVTKTIKVPTKPRWAVGITAGYGASKDGLSPYFGVGATYIIKSW